MNITIVIQKYISNIYRYKIYIITLQQGHAKLSAKNNFLSEQLKENNHKDFFELTANLNKFKCVIIITVPNLFLN